MNTCFFIGHREADDRLFPTILEAAETLIVKHGVTTFFVGGYGGFDRLAGRAVVLLKARYPAVSLFRVLPYHPAERPTSVPEGYDGTYYPSGLERTPRRFAISRANHIMVENCDYLIAYVWRTASNAGTLLEYAKRREREGLLRVVNLADHSPSPLQSNRR